MVYEILLFKLRDVLNIFHLLTYSIQNMLLIMCTPLRRCTHLVKHFQLFTLSGVNILHHKFVV